MATIRTLAQTTGEGEVPTIPMLAQKTGEGEKGRSEGGMLGRFANKHRPSSVSWLQPMTGRRIFDREANKILL